MKQLNLIFVLSLFLNFSGVRTMAFEYEERVVNGNFEGSDFSSFAFDSSNQQLTGVDQFVVVDDAEATNHCVKVVSVENASQIWDTRFFIKIGEALSAGDKIMFSMRAKASRNFRMTSYALDSSLGLVHYTAVGTFNLTTEWNTITYTGTVSSKQEGTQIISFNLCETNAASAEFYFDDISVKIKKSNPNPIQFADENVKAICVSNWDTNGDGELNYSEAENVTDLGNAFQYKQIDSFDELQYFTGLKTITPEAFWYSSLSSVVLPTGITKIEDNAFNWCRNLTSVTFPDGLEIIGHRAFYGCGLTSVTLPSSVIIILDYAFDYCANLTTVKLTNSVEHIGESAFSDCYKLTTVECDGQPSVLQKSDRVIGAYAFDRCSALTFVAIPKSIRYLSGNVFANCTALTEITIPQNVEYLSGNTFQLCI